MFNWLFGRKEKAVVPVFVPKPPEPVQCKRCFAAEQNNRTLAEVIESLSKEIVSLRKTKAQLMVRLTAQHEEKIAAITTANNSTDKDAIINRLRDRIIQLEPSPLPYHTTVPSVSNRCGGCDARNTCYCK